MNNRYKILHKKRKTHPAIVKMKRNPYRFHEEDDETDYVLAEIGSRVEDDKPADSQNVSNGVMGEVMVIGIKTNSMQNDW